MKATSTDSAAAPQVRERDTWDERFLAGSTLDRDRALHYTSAIPAGYKQDRDPERATDDVTRLEGLTPDALDLRLERAADTSGEWRLTLYVGGRALTLSEVLPILQSLGVEVLDERPYTVANSAGVTCRIYEFTLRYPARSLPEPLDERDFAERFTTACAAIWHGRAEADSFNELVARAGLNWRQVAVLRAYANYLRQGGLPYSRTHIATVLGEHRALVHRLIELFEVSFDPERVDPAAAGDLTATLDDEIAAVPGLDADRILRAYRNALAATLRTNFYRDVTEGRECLSFKLDPRRIPELPLPRPHFEIYVYSPRVEGVHMRFGKVARGGLRWSDRKEDFRTEVLGLAKAQAVKNAVIVPVGAKGGFVVKRPPAPTGDAAADREALREEGIRCYRTFVGGLLDLTDNVDLASGAVLPPARVVRRDGDDSYLVVAADKGTATFSDLANEVAAEYGFWLGDAFASGGSVGYDHKALGITAKGAWRSVRRHFRELGIDTQAKDFTVAGIGDMSGDVFGNGMLCSPHIRLVAAFDHRHIFLDPDPDAARSFAERARLFALPRSSWADYAPELISPGGGVWERTAKAVPIAPQVRAALGLADGVTTLTPPELVRAILCAPVDLLWNGGIGTYVKAATESHLDVGDKGNDAVRVDGAQLRARVVGEGGNLGFTQLGRIEFARAGGRINTDALDNSAGVDCSDHEVNIKILLDGLVGSGRLDAAARNALLAETAGEVSRLVLADNESQNELMGTGRARAAATLAVHGRLIEQLEATRGLDRTLEALPTKKEIAARRKAGQGLTSPELATLLAHVKLALAADLLAGDLPDSAAFADDLAAYFPARLRENYADAIAAHPLRREIVATVLTNTVVDHGGITYAYRLAEESGADNADAVRAFAVVAAVFDLPALWRDIRAAGLSADLTDELIVLSRRLLDRGARWMLTQRPQPLAVGAEIRRFRDTVAALTPHIASWLTGRDAESLAARTDALTARGVPADLARRLALLLDQFALLDIIEVAELSGRPPRDVAEVYYLLGDRLEVVPHLVAVSRLERGTKWNALARVALRDELYATARAICRDVLLDSDPGEPAEPVVGRWEQRSAARLDRTRRILGAIAESGEDDLAALSVATRQLRALVR
ncbi:NAD-glutamate dehydrogenase [Nocardia puris]|nr:NAD-glutamate dehydrogenase [Nocardia puris]MBF6368706.1 NAD-glutamate dehydrogenase [Nocardia puris]MBF6461621.1 NAD-glutamate dehydrogenase [Nocardia puris]